MKRVRLKILAVLLVMFATAQTSLAVVTFVQAGAVENVTGTATATVTLTAVAAGNFLVAHVLNFTVNTLSSVTAGGVTMTQAVTVTNAGSGTQTWIFYLPNVAGGNTDVVATFSATAGADSYELEAGEYSGVATANPLDVVSPCAGTNCTGNSTSAATDNATTTAANDLLIGGCGNFGAGSQTATGGATQRAITTSNGSSLQDVIGASQGVHSQTTTLGVAAQWNELMAAFFQAGAAAPAGGNKRSKYEVMDP